jgi:hypothetical protein
MAAAGFARLLVRRFLTVYRPPLVVLAVAVAFNAVPR